MKQVEVTILGQSYILACPDDGEAALHVAVADVDREMSAIRDAGRVKARERIAVLAALNLAYRLAERSSEETDKSSSKRNGKNSSSDTNGAGPDIARLIQRIDDSLAEDGRLL